MIFDFVCVYVCMCIHMCTRVYVFASVYICERGSIYDECIRICICVCVCVNMERDRETESGIYSYIHTKKYLQGWVETTYLDDDLRVGRGDKGSIFVAARRPE